MEMEEYLEKSMEGQMAAFTSIATVLEGLQKSLDKSNELTAAVLAKQAKEDEDVKRMEEEDELAKRIRAEFKKMKDEEEEEELEKQITENPVKISSKPDGQQAAIGKSAVVAKAEDEEEELPEEEEVEKEEEKEEEEEEEYPEVEKMVQKQVQAEVEKRLRKMGFVKTQGNLRKITGTDGTQIMKGKKTPTREDTIDALKGLSWSELNNMRLRVEAGELQMPEFV